MKTFLVFVLLCLGSGLVFAQSESPYFQVTGTASSFPLESTSANVSIAGVIAEVRVEQVYVNDGDRPLDATYVFPGATTAAVHALDMQVGQRTIEGVIMRKAAARQTYETARAEGKRASLLEQDRPNIFQMSVANILPGDTVRVQLRYTELLVPESGTYKFVYPTVVGPRFTGEMDQNSKPLPIAAALPAVVPDFHLDGYLAAGMPIAFVGSPTHRIRSVPEGEEAVRIGLDETEVRGGNRDFVLEYKLGGEGVHTGLLLFEGEKENYFLYMAQPPVRKSVAPAMPAREFVFIVDVSGSMEGFPLTVSKQLLQDLIGQLRPTDRFNVLLFAGAGETWQPASVVANQENIDRALDFLQHARGGGGTELLSALNTAYALPTEASVSRNFVIVTDGYISVEPEVFDLIGSRLDRANVYSFGIGSSINRYLIEGMARVGRGRPAFVLDPSEAAHEADRFRTYINTPLLTGLAIDYGKLDVYDVEPTSLPDLGSERPLVVFGKYRGKAKGTLALSNRGGDAGAMTLPIKPSLRDKRNTALPYLWARQRIQRLDDYNGLQYDTNRVEEVTQLGLDYHLLTAYTSFVAVDRSADSLQVPIAERPEAAPAVGFDLAFVGVTGLPTDPTGLPWWSYATLLLIIAFAAVVYRKMRGLFATLMVAVSLVSCEKASLATPVEGAAISDATPNVSAAPLPTNPRSTTFILGEDDGSNPYYRSAEAYFTQRGDAPVTGLHNLAAVRDYLGQLPATSYWDTVRLVVHGNPWTGLAAGLHPGQTRLSTAALAAESVEPLTGIDERTEIIIQGCGVGEDAELLAELSRYFGGRGYPTVSAPKQFTVFRQGERGTELRYANYYFRARPLGDYPLPSVMAVRFGRQHPGVDLDWEAALGRGRATSGDEPYLYQFNVPVTWTQLHPEGGEVWLPQSPTEQQSWLAGQSELTTQLSKLGLTAGDFRWTFRKTTHQLATGQRLPAVEAKGTSRLFCILQPAAAADTVRRRYFREV